MPSDPVRAFVALECPRSASDEVRDALSDWKRSVRGVRWARPESLHLTLRFLGDVDADLLERIDIALRAVASEVRPIPFGLDATGAFPGWRKPRVLWIGCRESGGIEALADRVEGAARSVGLPPERRDFTPHVTVARGGRDRVRGLDSFRAWRSTSDTVDVSEMILFRSDLGSGGARHTPLARYFFGRPE